MGDKGNRAFIKLKKFGDPEKTGRREKIDQGLLPIFVEFIKLGCSPDQIENMSERFGSSDNVFPFVIFCDLDEGADIKGKMM